MTISRRPLLVFAGAAAAVIAATAGTALSQSPGPGPMSPSDDRQLPQAQQVDAQIEKSFEIFRRAKRAEDAVPAAATNLLGESAGRALGGANPALSRRPIATPNGQIYALAANSQLCLLTSRAGAGNSGNCADAASAARMGLTTSQAARPGSTDRLIQGLVPDGVTRVRFRTQAGQTVDGDVVDNAFQVVVPSDTIEVEFIGTGQRVPIVQPPAS